MIQFMKYNSIIQLILQSFNYLIILIMQVSYRDQSAVHSSVRHSLSRTCLSLWPNLAHYFTHSAFGGEDVQLRYLVQSFQVQVQVLSQGHIRIISSEKILVQIINSLPLACTSQTESLWSQCVNEHNLKNKGQGHRRIKCKIVVQLYSAPLAKFISFHQQNAFGQQVALNLISRLKVKVISVQLKKSLSTTMLSPLRPNWFILQIKSIFQ